MTFKLGPAPFRSLLCGCFSILNLALPAQDDDQTGIKIFRTATTNLYGSGIHVAQVEADGGETAGAQTFEVNPTNTGSPNTIFTYMSTAGTNSVYPNTVGVDAYHPERVGQFFYGTVSPGQTANGVATNVAHVDVVDANFFYTSKVELAPVNLGDPIINQSYSYGNVSTNATPPTGQISVGNQQALDTHFDNYAAQFGVLLVAAAGESGTPAPPGTSYNTISVAAYSSGADSASGPTMDNGRCKPDLSAPDANTSFAAPQVAGSAAVLMQAGLRGDGGPNTNAAVNMRTLKALLLNGAVKPAGWTNSAKTPLDARYGAGMLNLFNSYRQLAGGRHTNFVVTSVTASAAHPPTTATNTIGVLSGWDFNTNNSTASADAINHYCFNVTNSAGKGNFLASATLVWNRQNGSSTINNLRLYLYNTANSNLVACSTSAVDNVQHLWLPSLAPGRYDLQVWKAGGASIVSTAEPYALAFAFVPVPKLTINKTGTNTTLTWPAYPAGFVPQAAGGVMGSPSWSTNNLLPLIITNQQAMVVLSATNKLQAYRLVSPNF